jgi:SAM-dependent methyltransferase
MQKAGITTHHRSPYVVKAASAMERALYKQGDYARLNPTWHAEDSPWKARHILRLLTRNRIQPKSIGEVGCGAGEILRRLYDALPEDVELVGYEISPEALEMARTRAADRLRFELSAENNENVGPHDLLLIIDVVEHVEDYYGFLRSLKDKSDYKILHIPLELSAQVVLRGRPLLRSRQQIGHIHYFTRDTALAALRETGYQVLDSTYTAGSLELAPGSRKAVVARLPRRLGFSVAPHLTVRALGGYSLLVLAR